MDRTHSGASQQVHPKERGNHTETYTTALQRHAINQTETGGPQHNSSRTPRDPNTENKSNFPQGHRVI